MKITVVVMFLLAGATTICAYIKDHSLPLEGLKAGGKMFWNIFPALVFAFIAAGMISKILPRELMSRWLGEESGLRGLIIATIAGSITPGGPFVQFPIVAALLKSGAGVAPVMAYISSWSLLGVNRFLIYGNTPSRLEAFSRSHVGMPVLSHHHWIIDPLPLGPVLTGSHL